MRIQVLFLSLLLFASAGCANQAYVTVNGFLDTTKISEIPNSTSIGVFENPNTNNPIFEKEVAAKIRKLLCAKGYNTTTNTPKYCLFFDYGVDSGRTVTKSIPIYEPGGTATVNTFGNYGNSSFSTVQMPGHTTYVPHSETLYTRWLVLKLFVRTDYNRANDTNPVWIGEITSSGRNSDLREMINYMLVVAFEHLGENTTTRVGEYIS